MSSLWIILGIVLVVALFLGLWRLSDLRAERRARHRLIQLGAIEASVYDPAMVEALPEPARRFFNFTLRPGTPLHPVVEIEMEGELSLGTRDRPNYRPMHARQLLAAPHGFIWTLRWNGVLGSDGALPERSWTRFWLFGVIPVARACGRDHLRSSFGRLIADSVFWAPASLLPSERVRWEPLAENSARVIATSHGMQQAVDLHVDEHGQLQRLIFQRWSDANPERVHRLQPFGGEFSDFETFGGYRLPTTVVAGNHYGTEDYFPFFKARVTGVRYPGAR
jgi:hypothetical protein